ncbi:MAG TPA: hypothetical protein VNX21_03320 [Candidatus Thermoplasmatota archaeon]|nr:hypothetical protein [Candidatus Thermoplasmatota archaeon]
MATQVSFAEAPQNDAGMGGDAGGSRLTATPLPAYGTYAGELRAQDDDWYTTVRAPGPACVQMDVTGDTYSDAALAIATGGTSYGVRAPIIEGTTTRLALAGSSIRQTWEGFVRTANPAGNDAARPRYYSFALSEASSFQGDGGASGDAGASPATARALPGACSGGSLQPLSGLGDTTDLYAFTLGTSRQVVYSLGASAPVTLELLDANGATAAPAIGPDQVATASLPAGTYYMRMSTSVSGVEVVTYLTGLLGPDPPPGSPCRPYCMLTG